MCWGALGLKLSAPKSLNFIESPGLFSGSVFRRVPNSFRKCNLERSKLDGHFGGLVDAFSSEELFGRLISPLGFRARLPFARMDDIEVLGVTFDANFRFTKHINYLSS